MNKVYEAHLWLSKHSSDAAKYAGKWIAISAKGIISNANSLKELLKDKAVKPKDMLVTRIPTKAESEATWSL